MALLRRVVPIAAAVVVLTAAPAAADPARPTDYRSTIDAVEPDVDGIRAEIVGGDAFIQLSVDEGLTVVVEGYQGEPYIRFLPDGTVQENQRSTATYLNETRYIDEPEAEIVPAGLDPSDEPEWHTVGGGGTHAWHDHRIHWMSPDRPEGTEPGDVLQTQDVLLTVDGEPVAITVSVVLAEPVSPLPWIAVGVATLALLVAIGWRRGSLAVAAAAAAVASLLAAVAGQGELAATPAGAGGSPLVVIIPGIGLAAAVLAGVLLWRKATALAGVSLLASAAALGGWAVLRLAVLFKPVLPTDLAAGFDRGATAAAVGVAAAVAVLTFHSGAVAPAPLTDDEEPADAR